METNEELIKRAIKEGHEIAHKIQSAKTISEIDRLSDEVEKYCDFVNENFGVLNDYDEKDCEISVFLNVAFDWKRTSLQPENIGNPATENLYEEFMRQYLDFLDSKVWIKESYGIKL